jgi:hypothetical protein
MSAAMRRIVTAMQKIGHGDGFSIHAACRNCRRALRAQVAIFDPES